MAATAIAAYSADVADLIVNPREDSSLVYKEPVVGAKARMSSAKAREARANIVMKRIGFLQQGFNGVVLLSGPGRQSETP
jgi:hypothetical protein